MRDIKFRGQRVDNNKWVEGSLALQKTTKYDTLAYICPIISYNEDGFISRFEKVFFRTIGQYTGLKDKNGKEIFEGDIVKNGLSGTWIVQPLESGSISLLGTCKQYKGNNFDISSLNYNVEVIGNIHENPELR